jgi:hypothetical protein
VHEASTRLTRDAIGTSRITPSRTLFTISWRRIWSIRAVVVWETILWSILALYLGLLTGDLRFVPFSTYVMAALYWLVIMTTPIVIAVWITHVHITTGSADNALLSTSIAPLHVITPRFFAIFLSYIRLYAPLVILILVLGDQLHKGMYPWINERMMRLSVSYLFGNVIQPRFRPDFGLIVWHYWYVVLALNVTQFLGWAGMPTAWGLWWSSEFRGKPIAFLFMFAVYLVFPVFLIWVAALLGPQQWFGLLAVGLAPILFTLMFFIGACLTWGWRAK